MDKTYTTLEMFDMLLKNPEAKAFTNNIGFEVKVLDGKFLWPDGSEVFVTIDLFNVKWRIVLPETEVDFTEAFKACKDGKGIKSIVSGEAYWTNSSKYNIEKVLDSEIDGKWIILD